MSQKVHGILKDECGQLAVMIVSYYGFVATKYFVIFELGPSKIMGDPDDAQVCSECFRHNLN